MKIICLVKYVPDVDNFKYDYDNNVLIRENVRLLLNPDDACAVAFALRVKSKHPKTSIEVVTMAPSTVIPNIKDLIRIGVDRGTIISDSLYAGSDTYATSIVISKYLSSKHYDAILTGTHAIDGDTSHIPSQIGACLFLNQMSNIVCIDEEHFNKESVIFDVETDNEVSTYEMRLPAILSLNRESKYKLPYVSRENMYKDVSDAVNIITNDDLEFKPDEVGLKGSPTKVANTYTKEFNKRNRVVVKADDEGVNLVFNYLRDRGFV